jgi:hypothetical protein
MNKSLILFSASIFVFVMLLFNVSASNLVGSYNLTINNQTLSNATFIAGQMNNLTFDFVALENDTNVKLEFEIYCYSANFENESSEFDVFLGVSYDNNFSFNLSDNFKYCDVVNLGVGVFGDNHFFSSDIDVEINNSVKVFKVIDDYGVDLDNNGLYDYLVVEISVTIPYSGEYHLFADLDDDIWEKFYAGIDEYNYLNKGNHTIYLNFSGKRINFYEENSSYLLDDLGIECLSTECGDLRIERENFYNTSFYNYTEFELAPRGEILGITEYTEDLDNDGLYDYLVVNVSVNLTDSSLYQLMSDWRITGGSFVFDQDVETNLNSGLNNIPIKISGRELHKIKLNGSLDLDRLGLTEETIWLLLDVENNYYTTGNYSYLDFERPELEVTGNITDYGEDINKNGLYDYLVLKIPVNVTKSDNYFIELEFDELNLWFHNYVFVGVNDTFIEEKFIIKDLMVLMNCKN